LAALRELPGLPEPLGPELRDVAGIAGRLMGFDPADCIDEVTSAWRTMVGDRPSAEGLVGEDTPAGAEEEEPQEENAYARIMVATAKSGPAPPTVVKPPPLPPASHVVPKATPTPKARPTPSARKPDERSKLLVSGSQPPAKVQRGSERGGAAHADFRDDGGMDRSAHHGPAAWGREWRNPGLRTEVNKIRELVTAGEISAAEALLESIRLEDDSGHLQSQLGAHPFNWIISAYGKRGDWEGAERWLYAMERDFATPPSATTYNSVINARATSGMAHEAEQWLDTMIAKGLEPDIFSYNTVIKAHAGRGNIDNIDKWMEHLGDLADGRTYGTAMMAYARLGDAGRVEHWLNTMASRGLDLDEVVYSAAVLANAKAGDPSAAREWLDRALCEGLRLDLRSYTPLVDAYAKAGDEAGVREMLDIVVRSGLEPDGAIFNAAKLAMNEVDVAAILRVPLERLRDLGEKSYTRRGRGRGRGRAAPCGRGAMVVGASWRVPGGQR